MPGFNVSAKGGMPSSRELNLRIAAGKSESDGLGGISYRCIARRKVTPCGNIVFQLVYPGN